MPLHRPAAWPRRLVLLVVSTLVAAAGGCQDRVDESLDYDRPVPSVPEIALIVPSGLNPEMVAIQQEALAEAGKMRVVFAVEGPREGDPPDRQAELIEAAVARGASALIIVPDDDPAVAPGLISAMAAARSRQVPIVLVGRAVDAGGDGLAAGPGQSIVVTADLDRQAAALADALIDAARNHTPPLPPEGPALVVASEGPVEDLIAARRAAIRGALERAGVAIRPDATVAAEPERARVQIKDLVAQEPTSVFIVALDDPSLLAAAEVRALRLRRSLSDVLIGGFGDGASSGMSVSRGLCDAMIESQTRKAAIEATRLAIRMAQGETVPETVEVPMSLRRSRVPPSPELITPRPEGESKTDPRDF